VVWRQEKKERFSKGEVFFLLTYPLMDDPPYKSTKSIFQRSHFRFKLETSYNLMYPTP